MTSKVLLGAAIFLGSMLLSLFLVAAVLATMPEDYFDDRKRRPARDTRGPALRMAVLVGKNLLGYLMILVGIVLSVPGIPGQGLLTVLLGVMLIDFPGKYRIERALLRQRGLLRGANALRRKFGKPPFTLPPRPRSERTPSQESEIIS